MAIVFEGEVKVMLNRHQFMGDGITLYFPEFLIFQNTSEKYTLQYSPRERGPLKTDYESVTDAYIAAQLHLGNFASENGTIKPKDCQCLECKTKEKA